MPRFLALYIGSAANDKQNDAPDQQTEQKGLEAWGRWATEHNASIVEQGGPLGKTLKVDRSGVSKASNQITGYLVVEADSQEQAAEMFRDHPHFTVFSDLNSVEVLEVLEMPSV